MTERALLTDVHDILNYLTFGHGTFTIKSLTTGNHYTYKMDTPDTQNLRYRKRPLFVSVLGGSNNEADYVYAGTIWLHEDCGPLGLVPTKKSTMTLETPCVRALNWFLHFLNEGEVPHQAEFYHEGVCGHCGRKLTTPESIARGIGPVCASRHSSSEDDQSSHLRY